MQHDCSWVHRAVVAMGRCICLRLSWRMSLRWRRSCFKALLEPCPPPCTAYSSLYLFFQPPTWLCHLLPCGRWGGGSLYRQFPAVQPPKDFWMTLSDHPKNLFCCTCLHWIKRHKVPFWVLCLSTGLRYACSFCCCDTAGFKDLPEALKAGCFQAGKLTFMLI